MSDNVNIIVQDTINEIVVNTAVVVETIDINVQVAVDEVNIIANPNNYVVNINRIIGEQVQSDWDQNDNQEPDYIKNKPSIPSIAGLATVVYVDQQDDLKVDKVAGKGLSENDFTNTLKTKLDGIESGAQVNVNADWNATTGDAEILNKPTIPAAQVNSDWNATSGVAEILNKPTIPAAVTNTSELINDGEDGVNPFITAQDIPTFATADRMVTVGRNSTGSTLYRGTIVYILGSTGNRPNFVKSIANSEGTSAGTFGVIENDIPNNSDGNCVTIGVIDNLDTRSNATHPFTTNTLVDGDTIYLSPTNAGFITNVKPSAPDHLVYIGKVVRTSPTNGTIVYRIQNGYELQELHNVAINGVSNNQLLAYESSTSLWKNKSVTTAEITDSTNKRYVTDANLTTIGNQSGVNTGDETTATIKTKLGITTLSGSNTGDQDLSGLTPNTRSISTTTPLQGGGDLSANRTLSILQSNTTQSGFLSNTDWNTFNGKQNALTNPITGTGTINYLPKFTGASSLGNSIIYDTGSRIGIGGVGINIRFEVFSNQNYAGPTLGSKLVGTSSILSSNGLYGLYTGVSDTGSTWIQSQRNDTATAYNINLQPSGGNVLINTTTDNGGKLQIKAPGALSTDIALRLRNSADSGDLMLVNGLGNVGIGIAAPLTKLDIFGLSDVSNGLARFMGNSLTEPSFFTFGRISTVDLIVGSVGSAANLMAGTVQGDAVVRSSSGKLHLGVGYSNPSMTFISGGNVGIGTTSPAASSKLDITSTTQGVLFPRMTTTQKNAIASPATGLVVFDTTLNKLCVRGASAWETITSI
jgi:hypothetical protein